MNNYNISAMILNNVQYNFSKPEKKNIAISVDDCIKVVEINENQAVLNVERTLSFDVKANFFIKIYYEVEIDHGEPIVKQEVINALRDKSLNLTAVYSKISLLISQITNMCPFGVLITPPGFDTKKASIE